MSRNAEGVKAPGVPVRGSQSGRPLMVLFDVLGRRWTMRILWELRDGVQSFRALRARCDELSPTVLNDRLKQLRALNLVDLKDEGYDLTDHGVELGRRLAELDCWSQGWALALGDKSERDE